MSKYLDLYNEVVERLSKEPELQQYKFLKSTEVFKLKTNDGWYEITVLKYFEESWKMVSVGSLEVTTDFLCICTIALRKFNLAMKWFEPFVQMEKREYQQLTNLNVCPEQLGLDRNYYFSLDKSNFETEYRRLHHCISMLVKTVMTEYHSITQYYEKKVKPILQTPPDPNGRGIVWVFEYMFLSRLIDPINYEKIKSIFCNHIQSLKRNREPNYENYEHLIQEIIEALEREADIARKKRN